MTEKTEADAQRDHHVIARALTIAIEFISTLPENSQLSSDVDDMKRILRAMLSTDEDLAYTKSPSNGWLTVRCPNEKQMSTKRLGDAHARIEGHAEVARAVLGAIEPLSQKSPSRREYRSHCANCDKGLRSLGFSRRVGFLPDSLVDAACGELSTF